MDRVFRVALDFACHVGVDLEERREVRVKLGKQIVDDAFADQHHLDIKRRRIGFHLGGAGQPDQFGERFDPHLTRLEGALESFPGIGLGQHLHGIEHQKTAVGAMQGARLDQHEIGDQRAHVHQMFDAPDQVLQGRVVFIHHRTFTRGRILHQQIDQIALDRDGARVGGGFRILVALGRFAQGFAARGDILHDSIKITGDLGQVGITRFEFLDQVAHRQFECIAGGLPNFVLHLAPPARELVHQSMQLLVKHVDLPPEFLLSFFRQLLELFLGEGFFAVFDRRKEKALRGVQQRNALLAGFMAEMAQGRFFALFFFLLQGLDATAVFIAFKSRGDGRPQFADKALQVVAQAGAPAARQAQQVRPGRGGKIVDIAPVRRRRAALALRFEQLVDDGVTAAARVAQHEQVVTLLLDVESEMHGLDGARMNLRGVEIG